MDFQLTLNIDSNHWFSFHGQMVARWNNGETLKSVKLKSTFNGVIGDSFCKLGSVSQHPACSIETCGDGLICSYLITCSQFTSPCFTFIIIFIHHHLSSSFQSFDSFFFVFYFHFASQCDLIFNHLQLDLYLFVA